MAATEEEAADIRRLQEARGLMPAGLLARDSAVWFDVAKERLVVADAELASAPKPDRPGYTRLLVGRLPHAPFRFVDGAEGVLLLDTGKNGSFTFSEAWLRGAGVEGKPVEADAGKVLGMAGIREKSFLAAPDMTLWETFDFRDIVASVSTDPFSTPYETTADAGLVGWAVLREFSPTFDYKSSEVTLVPPAAWKRDAPADEVKAP
jgi:hypothetical protein